MKQAPLQLLPLLLARVTDLSAALRAFFTPHVAAPQVEVASPSGKQTMPLHPVL